MISVIFEQIFNTVVTEAACLLNGADYFFISQIEPKRQTPRLCTRLIQNFEKYRSKRFRLLKQEQGIWACKRFFCNGSTKILYKNFFKTLQIMEHKDGRI